LADEIGRRLSVTAAMRVLVTGICGFVGSSLTRALLAQVSGAKVYGIDNFVRPGSETNRLELRRLGVGLFHGDVRCASDFEQLPDVDWVIDAAAQPSVLIGADGRTSSRQAVEHNLFGTINILEYCKARKAGLVLLSSSRVYSIPGMQSIPLKESAATFLFDETRPCPPGVSAQGMTEDFSTSAPVSLYGATKLASEAMALEYGCTYNFPVWINRCGVLAGAGQFGTAEQGIFSFWLHAHARRRPIGFFGFGGRGLQVRDALHPSDLAMLVLRQITDQSLKAGQILHVAGGIGNSMSLAQLTAWCDDRFGKHPAASHTSDRPFDVPWVVLDSSRTRQAFGWTPAMTLPAILNEIAGHVETHPDWLSMTGA
jgi:CDP-paratose 2-epimerase